MDYQMLFNQLVCLQLLAQQPPWLPYPLLLSQLAPVTALRVDPCTLYRTLPYLRY